MYSPQYTISLSISSFHFLHIFNRASIADRKLRGGWVHNKFVSSLEATDLHVWNMCLTENRLKGGAAKLLMPSSEKGGGDRNFN